MGTVGYGQLVRQFEVDPGVTSIGQMNKMDHEDKNASSKSQIDENMNQEEKIALEMLDNVVNEADQDRTITDQDEDNVNPEVETKSFWKDLDGDKKHVAVLFFLYVLQGIPLGLHSSIPLILQNRDVAYKEQAKFSFSSYPFSMKLLWAPIVDSLFIKRFGRRKTWLVPSQYLIGIMMLVLSQYVDTFLGEGEGDKPDVTTLAIAFFFLTFLAATQDVAVDGWALTMLKPGNVGYASTCNSVGQTAGWCLGFILYTVLDSNGLINLSQFMLFWGVIFLATTTFIAFFKREKNTGDMIDEEGEPDLGIVETYKVLWKLIRHRLMPVIIVFLLTNPFGFAAAESLTNLKLIASGVPKDKIAMMAIPMIPVKILFTLFISRYTVGPRPMNVWLISFPVRLVLCLSMALLVYVTPMFMLEDGGFPVHYYVIIIAVFALHRVSLYAMFVAIMAFHARISDPAVGGTNMTFLNTLANLGGMWPASFVLWFVDIITWKDCTVGQSGKNSTIPSPVVFTNSTVNLDNNVCYGEEQVDACKAGGGTCDIEVEGFYYLAMGCFVIGCLWFIWGWRTMRRLQKIDVLEWRVVKKDKILNDVVSQKPAAQTEKRSRFSSLVQRMRK